MKKLRWFVLAIATVMLTMLPAGSARAADDFLDASDPAPQAELKQAPGWVTLVFKEDSNRSIAAIVVLNADGKNVATGPLIVEGTNVTTQLKSGLGKGTYTVVYRTVDEFNERRGGSFQFAYGKGDWTPVENEVWKGETAEPTVLQAPQEETETASPAPSEFPEDSESASPIATPLPSATPTAGGEQGPANMGDSTAWILGGGTVILLLAAGGGWLAWRRRNAERG